jgi:hypothetical protein
MVTAPSKDPRISLRAMSVPGTPLDHDRLLPYLRSRDDGIVGAAIGAAGFVCDPRLVAEVFAHWDGPRRLDVALYLGRVRATQHTPDLLDLLAGRLGGLEHQAWEHCTVALELMADPACVAEVRSLLRAAPAERVWSLVQILRAATGEDRLADWIDAGGRYDVEVLRRAWLEASTGPLGLRSFEPRAPLLAEILVQGTARVRMGYPAMITAGNWARWERALYYDGEILYHANSSCPTCETYLGRAGASRPRVDADRVGKALSHVPSLSRSLLEALEPALIPLPAGRALVALVDVELERVDSPQQDGSWYAKRGRYRKSNDPDDDPDDESLPAVTWPGTAHYQAVELLAVEPPTSLTVLPTQSIDAFDEQVIARRTAALDDGLRPAALAVGWFEHRDVVGRYPEAMLQLVVLDGHHTLEAHARLRRPARLLVVCPFSFGSIQGAYEQLAGWWAESSSARSSASLGTRSLPRAGHRPDRAGPRAGHVDAPPLLPVLHARADAAREVVPVVERRDLLLAVVMVAVPLLGRGDHEPVGDDLVGRARRIEIAVDDRVADRHVIA